MLQNGFDFFRNAGELFDGNLHRFFVVGAQLVAEVQGQEIKAQELSGVGLGAGHGNFGAGVAVNDLVAFPVDTGAQNIGNGKDLRAPLLRFPKHGQSVAGFAGLAHDDEQTVFV